MKSPSPACQPGNNHSGKKLLYTGWTVGLVMCFYYLPLFSQPATTIDWATLANVKFEKKYSEELGIGYEQATFNPWLLALNGKRVAITGYIIPLDGQGINYVLSRNPNATCFFCGGAGPETVIELRLKPSALRRYKLDEIRTFKGILKLNASNLNQLTYVLLEAEPE